MIEQLSVGSWPANVVHDIGDARKTLQERGYAEANFTLLAHHKVLNILKTQVPNSHFTYEAWFLFNRVLHATIMDDELPDDVALVYATKKNFPFTHRYENPGWIIRDDSVVKITMVCSYAGE